MKSDRHSVPHDQRFPLTEWQELLREAPIKAKQLAQEAPPSFWCSPSHVTWRKLIALSHLPIRSLGQSHQHNLQLPSFLTPREKSQSVRTDIALCPM